MDNAAPVEAPAEQVAPPPDAPAPDAAANPTEEVAPSATEEAAPAAPATPPDATTPPAPPNPMLEKYNEHWNVVRENPADFQTWTLLISTTEKLDDVEKLRVVFDSFLAEYPLCYGYWKKYADAEVRHGHADVANHVFERGVSSIPYSVDLWGHYVTFKQTHQGTPDEVRSIFERGLAYVATDYNAHNLWDKYLQYELSLSNTQGVAAIFSRIMRSPLKELDRYYTSLKDLVAQHPASELMSMEELLAHKAEIEKTKTEAAEKAKAVAAVAAAKKAAEPTEAAVKPDDTASDAAPEKLPENGEGAMEIDGAATGDAGANNHPVVKDENADSKPEDSAASVNDENADPASNKDSNTDPALIKAEQTAQAPAVDADMSEQATDAPAAPATEGTESMQIEQPSTDAGVSDEGSGAAVADQPIIVTEDEVKQAWLQVREELYNRTKEELSKRKPYEDQIKRPYFHVKALDAVQLNNWNRYLTFIEQHGDEAAIITLYERCLVACASYPEFWQRYIRLMESINMDHATGALQRAVVIYCKRRPEMHLFAAHFEERHGNIDNARNNFKYILTELSPHLLAAVTAAANFEARQGNEEAAWSYFEDLIREEKSKENSKIYTHLCIQYAHFLTQKFKRIEKAREVLQDALEHSPSTRSLWEAAIFIEEMAHAPDMVARTLDLYNRCTASPADPAKGLSVKDREELSLRSVDFADLYGDPSTKFEAEKAHASRFMLPSSVTQTKKRPATEPAGAMASKTPRADGTIPLPPPPTSGVPPAPPLPAAGYYGQPPAAPAAAPGAAAAAGYNYAAYYQQYPGYGYGYGY